MEQSKLNSASAYAGSCMILTTKHSKSVAIAPPFWERLGASMLEYVADTDALGTFTGEVDRQGSALDCARRKCKYAADRLGEDVEFSLASEGSFGPHPVLGMVPCDHEILYFIDRRRDFHLHLSHVSEKTNYRTGTVDSWEALQAFASAADFPSHALIIRPGSRETPGPVYKDIETLDALEAAYLEARKLSANGDVWVETDMRAHMNPTRMGVIEELANRLSERLASHCPECGTPGWGRIRVERGLECSDCGSGTRVAKAEIAGCVKCDHEEICSNGASQHKAEPAYCDYCNP